MKTRRQFIQCSLSGIVGAMLHSSAHASNETKSLSVEDLEQAARSPILRTDLFNEPIIIKSIKLYKTKSDYILTVMSEDGTTGMTITNDRAAVLYPLLQDRVIPYFIGKDACKLNELIDGVYLFKSNYKLSGLALWCCVAWVEMAILDLLGKQSNLPVGELLGGTVRTEIPVYYASGNRHTTPQEEADIVKGHVETHGVKAVKFKVGGRMSNNRDSMPGRSEALIPLVRKTLGDDIDIHADSNGSYDWKKGIDIGKRLEDINAIFFEEPCPFDHLDETKRVADALNIAIAGGECENSMRRFRWMIEKQAVQVVQPDLHYFGGFIRAKRVAKMAELAGMPITLHMGGSGVGFVEVLQFASCTENVGPYQEFKGGLQKIGAMYDPPLRMKDGAIRVPKGPGLGLHTHQEFVKNAKCIVSS
jgi:L-alanine-DL-glutamate epimerase-like enolase superfamily enzyme